MQQPALVNRQVEVDERVVPAEVAQDLRQAGEGEVVGYADAEPAPGLGATEVGGRLLAGGEDITREPCHHLAVGGERDRVRVPQHERPADLLLQPADVLADGRLLEAEPGRGPGEAAGLLDGEERGQELRIVAGHNISQ